MLWLTEVIGQEVRDATGGVIGRVRDLTIRLDTEAPHARVVRLAFGARRPITHLVDWADIESFEADEVILRVESATIPRVLEPGPLPLTYDELLLVRDVLDTQIVDIAGFRLARVADVALTRTSRRELELVAVEVGFGRVVHRVGFDRLAERFARSAVEWTDLHLTSDRGHDVQLATPRSAVHRLDPRELAELVSRLDTESALEVVDVVGSERTAAALEVAPHAVGERVLRAASPNRARRILEHMPTASARHWRDHLRSEPILRGRRFVRSHGWRRPRVAPRDRRR